MADDATGEKTEKPSAQRLREAREKGQVAKSRDLVGTAVLIGVMLAITRGGGEVMTRIATRTVAGLQRVGDHPRVTLTPGPPTRNRVSVFSPIQIGQMHARRNRFCESGIAKVYRQPASKCSPAKSSHRSTSTT